ncbi:hypothetical protein HMPREF0526_11279 [Lactobacillus jensenii JV-V16]|nr:hypothetical protein HMPREF0526_11279 [Lactobacillus jensenii JV-V16]
MAVGGFKIHGNKIHLKILLKCKQFQYSILLRNNALCGKIKRMKKLEAPK